MVQFNRLVSGGMITNYDCSSKCRHCVYASSPSWPKDSMDVDTADEIFTTVKELGCSTLHIGGGEPLLRPTQLLPILKSAVKHKVSIEYVETNASWYRNDKRARELLNELAAHQVHTLLISMDPYHNEYIPFYKVKALMAACEDCGIHVFPWQIEFWEDMERMGDSIPHGLEAYEKVFGRGYQSQLPERYGLNLRGRALVTYRHTMVRYPLKEIVQRATPCRELTGVHHFHIDLYGYYIPQSCPGLAVALGDLRQGIRPDKYPVFCTLLTAGIEGLLDLAVSTYGFKPMERYMGKCDLCYEIRKYMVLERKVHLPELHPAGHYEFM